jgi:hypothetical protein
MKEFKFVMNEYKNVCYVFVDVNMPPVDTLHLIENKCQVTGNSIKEWMPQLYITKELLGFGSNLDMLKEHYNEHYDTVVDELNNFYKKRLLELPEKLDGFYLDSDSNKITKADRVANYERFGVAYSEEQAKGIQAFCELSQILPIFNEGWNPDWNKNYEKWCIKTTSLGINVVGYNHIPHFLSFQTKKKAELFLKEKIDLITCLSKAKII